MIYDYSTKQYDVCDTHAATVTAHYNSNSSCLSLTVGGELGI